MKVSLNWLRDHLDLSGLTTAEVADLLTFAGVEVEGVEECGVVADGVIVARILSSEPHPQADRLSVCQVDDGSGSPRQIVCGAKNYRVGDKVPLALPGAELPGGMVIRAAQLRGVESGGMMCSGAELGLGNDHAGLLILDPDAPVGRPLAELFRADTVFDVEITPNRPDLLSHRGMARELAALTGRPLRGEPVLAGSEAPRRPARPEEVELRAPERCPLYTARVVRGLRVGPSPEWLRERLERLGLRPINNVVDVTNYVLFETGQPLHAFDLAAVEGGICVRMAEEGERLTALDGETYTLGSEDLVIADRRRALAVAGVMGGAESGVTDATRDILLESAWFAPAGVRATSRRLGLASDSSYRFERGIDPRQTEGASDLAVRLLLEAAGGEAEELLVAGEPPGAVHPVELDHGRLRRLLGAEISDGEIGAILERLGLGREGGAGALTRWVVPSYRLDLLRPVDLMEEVARVYGIDRVPARHRAVLPGRSEADERYDRVLDFRRQLVARGFCEAQTIKLISEAQIADDLCGLRSGGGAGPVRLKNPLSDDHTTLRPGLLPGLLAVAQRNARMGAECLRFFEAGSVFSRHPRSPRAVEAAHLALVLSGAAEPRSWTASAPREADFHDLRGVLEDLLGVRVQVAFRRVENPSLVLCAEVRMGKVVVGQAGQLWPARARALDWDGPVFVAELDLGKVLRVTEPLPSVEPLPRFPAVHRDVAFEAPLDLEAERCEAFFAGRREPLLQGALLFDVFRDPEGKRLAADRKSLAYRLTYRAADRTLTSEEVDRAHGAVVAGLPAELGVRIR